MDSTQVGILEEADEVSLGGFLQGHDSRGLEAEVGLEVLSDLTDETLEGELPDEELSALLVTTDLTESDGTGPVTMGLLNTSCGRGRFASCLGGQLLTWGLASGGLPSSLLGTSHVSKLKNGRTNLCPFIYTHKASAAAAPLAARLHSLCASSCNNQPRQLTHRQTTNAHNKPHIYKLTTTTHNYTYIYNTTTKHKQPNTTNKQACLVFAGAAALHDGTHRQYIYFHDFGRFGAQLL